MAAHEGDTIVSLVELNHQNEELRARLLRAQAQAQTAIAAAEAADRTVADLVSLRERATADSDLREQLDEARRSLELIQATLSWKVTRPLRTVRSLSALKRLAR